MAVINVRAPGRTLQLGDLQFNHNSPVAAGLLYFVLTNSRQYKWNFATESSLTVTVDAFVTLVPEHIQCYDTVLASTSGQVQYTLSKSSWVGSYAVGHWQNGDGNVPWMFASDTEWDGLYSSNDGSAILTSSAGFGGSVNPGTSMLDGTWQRNIFSIPAVNNFRGARNLTDIAVDTTAALPISAMTKLVLGGDYSQANQTTTRIQYFAVWDRVLSDYEMREFNAAPFQALEKRRRVFYFTTAGGGATITGSGTPTAQASTVSGTAERSVTGSGTPTAQASTVAGIAERVITSSGALASQSSAVAGSGSVGNAISGSGTLLAQSSQVAGTAERSVTGTGAPASQAATVSGTAERAVTGTGAPTSQSSTASGTGQVGNVVTGSGSPTAQSATVSGTAERTVTSSGALSAQSSTVAGTAERTITGSGALSAQSSAVYGFDAVPVVPDTGGGGSRTVAFSSKKLRQELEEWEQKNQDKERLKRLMREDEELVLIMLALAA